MYQYVYMYTVYGIFLYINIINLLHQNMNISFLQKVQLSMKATSAIYFFPKTGDFFNIIYYMKLYPLTLSQGTKLIN